MKRKNSFLILEILVAITLIATIVFHLLLSPSRLIRQKSKINKERWFATGWPLAFASVLRQIDEEKMKIPIIAKGSSALLPWKKLFLFYNGKEEAISYKVYFHERALQKEGLDILYVEFEEMGKIFRKPFRIKALAKKIE